MSSASGRPAGATRARAAATAVPRSFPALAAASSHASRKSGSNPSLDPVIGPLEQCVRNGWRPVPLSVPALSPENDIEPEHQERFLLLLLRAGRSGGRRRFLSHLPG